VPTDRSARAAPVGSVDGGLIYAVGDVHGCYDQLRNLLEKIAADARERSGGRPVSLIFCGDYIDRGPASREVVDALWWLTCHGPFDLHCLKGNHEQGLLDYLDNPAAVADWMEFGGLETLRSYGVAAPEVYADPDEHCRARDDLLESMPAAHLKFFESLELMVGIGDYVFVHAGVRPGVPLEKQAVRDLLWIRQEWIENERPAERIVIHGHSWIDREPDVCPHRIGIDTGAYETGVLSAVRIEDGQIGFLSACASGR